ncbi:MAG: hypothetical protein V1837_04955 [Candidatus Woesearchaeota archaeon]
MVLEIKKEKHKFEATITRNGTSLCINIPARLTRKLPLNVGDDVDIELSRHYIELQQDTYDFLALLQHKPEVKGYSKVELLSYMVLKHGAAKDHKQFSEVLDGFTATDKKRLLELDKLHLNIGLTEVPEKAEQNTKATPDKKER